MNLPSLSQADFLPTLPALLLVLGACVLLLTEVFLRPGSSRGYQAVLTAVTASLAAALALKLVFEPAREVLLGFAVLDPFSSFLTFTVCVGLALAALTAQGF